jgi:hypothetical protein
MTERDIRLLRHILDNLRSIHQDIAAIREEYKSASSNDKIEPHLPLPIKISDSLVPPSITKHYEAEYKDRQTRLWKLKPYLETIGITAAVFIAFLTWCTLQEVREQTKGANRSWVQVVIPREVTEMPLDKIDLMVFQAYLHNWGRSPATKIVGYSSAEVVPSNSGPNFGILRTGINMGALFPDESTERVPPSFKVSRYGTQHDITRLTDDERNRLKNGDAYLAIYGRLVYTDNFGTHWTQFCGWLPFSSAYLSSHFNARECAMYNAVGEE